MRQTEVRTIFRRYAETISRIGERFSLHPYFRTNTDRLAVYDSVVADFSHTERITADKVKLVLLELKAVIFFYARELPFAMHERDAVLTLLREDYRRLKDWAERA